MEYQDLTIDLRSARRGRFEARVTIAPIADNPQVRFGAPVARGPLEAFHHSFDALGAKVEERIKALPIAPRTMGEQIFSGVFKNGTAEVLRMSQQAVSSAGAGLRVRLRFRADDPEADYLAALPWEWLWDPQTGEFLATNVCTPVVREIAAPRLRLPLEVEPPLRILVVDAAPKAMKELNLKLEIERMALALESLVKEGLVELVQLKRPDKDVLRDALLDERINVLHVMGHGGYDPDSGTGAIFFEKAGGGLDQVDGEMLAAYLKLKPDSSLRLVVLNACKTARYTGRVGAPLHFSLPSAVLTRTGVPAVIANQYSISDSAAIDFSRTFYGRIGAGASLEEAITEARLRLWSRSSEWGTSVLFLTAPNGRIFTVKPSLRKPVTVPVAPPQAPPLRLGVRTFDGWGRDMEERTDHVFDRIPLFEKRRIIQQPWWQEKIFPDLREFLLSRVDPRRPVLLDFAAHSSLAFAAGWLLEPTSGLDVRVRQRTSGDKEIEWSPKDGSEPEGALWLERPDVELDPEAPDIAVAVSVSQPDVVKHVTDFVGRKKLPIGRILDATIHPAPGPTSVRGGAHCLRLAQALMPRLQTRLPHERGGRVHFFCAAPNAFTFYLGQLASSLGRVVLYEFAFGAVDSFGRYQQSIELPPPDEAFKVGEDW